MESGLTGHTIAVPFRVLHSIVGFLYKVYGSQQVPRKYQQNILTRFLSPKNILVQVLAKTAQYTSFVDLITTH